MTLTFDLSKLTTVKKRFTLLTLSRNKTSNKKFTFSKKIGNIRHLYTFTL